MSLYHFSLACASILLGSKGGAYSECSMHQAATRPAIAPLAPREVTVNLWRRTWDVRDMSEPMTPEERYSDRKLPRPISSWTIPRNQSTVHIKKGIRELTSQSNQPQDNSVGK